jgi:hypothetical protein
MNYFISTIGLLLFFLTACNSKADDKKIDEKGVSEKIELIDIKDISKIPSDLVCPKITEEKPAAGKRVKVYLDKYKGTQLFHAVYLPTNWKKDNKKKYPVIIEYAGNGYSSERSVLGYGLSGGKDFICVNMPFVAPHKKSNQSSWWGDLEATLDYCKTAVPEICKKYGGDESKVFLAGFSRGSIACNYIGLHDDEIAKLWCGFICHSHYDERGWAGPQETLTQAACIKRLKRLGKRPQFISHERHQSEKHRASAINARKAYLKKNLPDGNFTFLTMSFTLHNVDWVLKDIHERKIARRWLKKVLANINQ